MLEGLCARCRQSEARNYGPGGQRAHDAGPVPVFLVVPDRVVHLQVFLQQAVDLGIREVANDGPARGVIQLAARETQNSIAHLDGAPLLLQMVR